MINWHQGDYWSDTLSGYGVKAEYGGVGVYGLTMTLGVLIAILFSCWNFYQKRLPFWTLGIAVIIIVPTALFGASFFGKLNAEGNGINANGVGFFACFAFWQAGMSIHGGVIFGTLSGIFVFGAIGRKTSVSLWAYLDAIIPNVLIGQAIGRWGNFFNHEVMGAPIKNLSSSIGTNLHLPNWLLVNTQVRFSGPSRTIVNGISFNSGDIAQMNPIFLWESLAFLAAWILIVFVVPNLFKLFGKKPWKNDLSMKYSLRVSMEKLIFPNKEFSQLSYGQVWDKEYYFNVDQKQQQSFQLKWDKKPMLWDITNRWEYGTDLLKANNPKKYWAPKSGVQGGMYFFVWNFVRFFLEMQRPDDHLFIMYDKTASLIVIMLTAFFGLLIIGWCQTIGATLFRKPGYMYEKAFFNFN